jgi:hypothetical protein
MVLEQCHWMSLQVAPRPAKLQEEQSVKEAALTIAPIFEKLRLI